jgi:hypothetical protein
MFSFLVENIYKRQAEFYFRVVSKLHIEAKMQLLIGWKDFVIFF